GRNRGTDGALIAPGNGDAHVPHPARVAILPGAIAILDDSPWVVPIKRAARGDSERDELIDGAPGELQLDASVRSNGAIAGRVQVDSRRDRLDRACKRHPRPHGPQHDHAPTQHVLLPRQVDKSKVPKTRGFSETNSARNRAGHGTRRQSVSCAMMILTWA